MSRSIALIGSGLIVRGWTILFANAGFRVRLYDQSPQALEQAAEAVRANLALLERERMIDSAEDLLSRVSYCATMAEAVAGVEYVQESGPEDREIKRAVFGELARLAAPDAVLASSCSSIPPAQFLEEARNRERCLIAHPFSPPHLVPLVELVPSPWTSDGTVRRTRELMIE